MVIQHNMASMNANRQLGVTQTNLKKSTEKLSSGYRINRAADDAAGLAISEKMRGQIRGLNQASRNAEDGISLIQTAEGALQESQNIIQRMRELSVQAASDTNTDDDREQIQQELVQLTMEVDRIATSTEYNTMKLLDGTQQGSTIFAVGNVRAESSFENGLLSVEEIDSDNYDRAALNDVVRIEFLRDGNNMTTATTKDETNYELATVKVVKGYDVNGDAITEEVKRWTLKATSVDGKQTDEMSDEELAIWNAGLSEETFANNILVDGTNVQEEPYQNMKITSLNGADKNVNFSIDGTDLKITINGGVYTDTTGEFPDDKNNLTFTIKNYEKVKANDIVTISLRGMVATKEPEPNSPALRLQVGANAGQEVCLGISDMRAKALHIIREKEGDALRVTSQAEASLAIEAYDMALQRVSKERAKLGAMQNRIEHTVANVDTQAENLQAAESGVRDVDMADEMTRYSKDNILLQAGQSMLAQANQMTQGVLSLLQG